MHDKSDTRPAISKESASRNTHSEAFDLLRRVCAGGAVLDIPCGSGAFTHRLNEAGYTVTAADIMAHPAVPAKNLRVANMNEPLPFADATFDAVISIEGIEHIQRPFDFIRECRRVLKPGGWLVLTTPNISSLRSRWRYFLTGFHNKCKAPLDETRPEPRHHIGMRSYPELRYMLHTSGFRIAEAATNRVKFAGWLFAPWVPLGWLASRFYLFREAKGESHRLVIEEVHRAMHTPAILFGETLLLVAQAKAGANPPVWTA